MFGVAVAVAIFGLLGQAHAASMYMAKLCRGQTCTDPNFPILDYDPQAQTCTCSAHPCWDDAGAVHYCSSSSNPYLEFSYTSDRKLTCRCLDRPWYNARHILHDLCPGHNCEKPEHPVLDWDENRRKCICRAHPCSNLDGIEHYCPADKVLRYREDEAETRWAQPKGVCECIPKMDARSVRSEL
mmetsp:Transcript_45498/g.114566  ORF Transcript_45498/g.114566 Transcript_45498/m.114566 type:complete len:184 (-) Transcript_45498:375-926(-)